MIDVQTSGEKIENPVGDEIASSATAQRRGCCELVRGSDADKEKGEMERSTNSTSSTDRSERIPLEPRHARGLPVASTAWMTDWARRFSLGIRLVLWRWDRRRKETREFIDQKSVVLSSQSSSATASSPKSTAGNSSSSRGVVRFSFSEGRRSEALPRLDTLAWKILTTAVLAGSFIFRHALAVNSTRLSFDPPEVGYPTEISFTFTPIYRISPGKFIRLFLAGFTRGSRDGTAGEDLGFNNEDDTGNDALVWPSDTFRGWWSEGTPENQYEDSIFNLYTSKYLEANVGYTVIIDRSSDIKSSCGHPQNYSAFYAWVDDTSTPYKKFGKVDYAIDMTDEIPMRCYVAPASLTYDPPLPMTPTHITVGFQPARNLVVGDNITINLQGFTSGNGNGTLGRDFEPGEIVLANDSAWLASWKEGTFVEGRPGYEESTLSLEALAPMSAGVLHEVTVYRSNGIRAQCGMPENDTSSTISVISASYPPWNATGEFTFTQTVGSGCRELNYCSYRGECDYCLQTCNCPEGFGSPSDTENIPDIARDCSDMACPFGISWTPVLSGHPRPDPDSSHTMAECSNMGTCVRSFGLCLCKSGFEGRACERYACPNMCSGNGACRNMREMGFMRAAEPLVNRTAPVSGKAYPAEGFEVAYGWDSPKGTGTWDSRSMFACVCDSTWDVGLENGQTQRAEYFGPDCSLVHCPTGDDPETDTDETDCTNRTAYGGRGVGSEGNLCHVDCSNRGICDYTTGVCSCFDGYHGQACDQKQVDGYGFNTDGL